MAVRDLTPPRIVDYLRARTGTPKPPVFFISRKYWKSRRLIGLYVVLALSALGLIILLRDLMANRVVEGGTVPGLNEDALVQSAKFALPTMAFWVVCFWLLDRFKPQRIMAVMALIWGACVAVFLAYYINSWADQQMAVVDTQPGIQAARTAVFVAPFVEEFCKACVIFLIAVIDRNAFSSRISGAILGGLAGAGFAFTENIVYYARAIVYGSYNAGTGDVMEAVKQLVMLRGVYTCFGHPLFTFMTGLGVAFAVTSRSKIVRVVAPVAGYALAACLHMLFNGLSMVMGDNGLVYVYLMFGLPLVIGVAIRAVMTNIKTGRMLYARLSDYATMGWIPQTYPTSFSTMRRRGWTLLMSVWHGNIVKTWQLRTAVTDLAVVREQITRGIVDQGGLWRERELVDRIAALAKTRALSDGTGLRPYLPWTKARRRLRAAAKQSFPTFGASASAMTAIPIRYSSVDPRWGPPT